MDKKEKAEILESYENYKKELMELSIKSRKLNYKCNPPKLPKNNGGDIKHLKSIMMGFSKRFSNWKFNLGKLEESNN